MLMMIRKMIARTILSSMFSKTNCQLDLENDFFLYMTISISLCKTFVSKFYKF